MRRNMSGRRSAFGAAMRVEARCCLRSRFDSFTLEIYTECGDVLEGDARIQCRLMSVSVIKKDLSTGRWLQNASAWGSNTVFGAEGGCGKNDQDYKSNGRHCR